MAKALLETNLPGITKIYRGKARDVFEIGNGQRLIVATDRISAFEIELASGIPGKGLVLTQTTLFWLKLLERIVPNHLITANVDDYPAKLKQYRVQLEGRSMLVQWVPMLPIESVARGYVFGSCWEQYQQSGTICGITLPQGLREADKLNEPIFTPTTKAPYGKHDEELTFVQLTESLGITVATELRKLTLDIYLFASQYTLQRGIILADTKLEFGNICGKLVLADEVITPDSSRFWPATGFGV